MAESKTSISCCNERKFCKLFDNVYSLQAKDETLHIKGIPGPKIVRMLMEKYDSVLLSHKYTYRINASDYGDSILIRVRKYLIELPQIEYVKQFDTIMNKCLEIGSESEGDDSDDEETKIDEDNLTDINDKRKFLEKQFKFLQEHYKLKDWKLQFYESDNKYYNASTEYGDKTIKIVTRYLREGSLQHLNNTLLHEVAHAIIGVNKGHDKEWIAVARAIGCNAKERYDK